jgi:hypothetical protein
LWAIPSDCGLFLVSSPAICEHNIQSWGLSRVDGINVHRHGFSNSRWFGESEFFDANPSTLVGPEVISDILPLKISYSSISNPSEDSDYLQSSLPFGRSPPWLECVLAILGISGIAWG